MTLTLLLLLVVVSGTQQFTLNVPNVLLPKYIPNTLHTNFTLTADSGCFTWLSTKELLVGINPLSSDDETEAGSDECTRQAELTALSQDSDRQCSLILAHETGSGTELRVDVFIDVINKITIKTTSLELLLEETPSTFEVIAFDSDGNTFSTLGGLEFTWSIEADETHVSGNVLKIIRYSDSSYLTPPTIGHLENQGKQGDKILVQGINTGVAWVNARLTHPSHAAVAEAKVRVVVIENLLLNPPYDVWVLPLTQISYKAERRQHGRKTEISFPSEQYSMSLTNDTVAGIQGTTVLSLMIGDTDVVLIDKNVQHLPVGSPPHTTVHVVPPSALVFNIAKNNWNFETRKVYNFSITVLGPHNRPIKIADNIRIKLTVEEMHVTVISSNLQGTQHVIMAESIGQTKITAVLDTLIHPNTGAAHPVEPVVTDYQTAVIRAPIAVVPVRVVLPLYHKQPYTYRLLASGGSGHYTWSSEQVTAVSVNKEGVVAGRDVGSVPVTAADQKNSENTASAQVVVAELTGLSFLPSKVEALVGSSLRLNLAAVVELEPGVKVPFTRCDLVPLVYSLSNDLFVLEKEEKVTGDLTQGVCSVLTVKAERPGNSIVKVTYKTATKELLTTTLTIAAYPALVLLHPAHVPIVTLGSSYVLSLSGGPQPWILDKSGYTEQFSSSPAYQAVLTNDVSVGTDKHAYGVLHSFRVTCTALGEQSGLVMVTNKVTKENVYPAGETLNVKIRCAVPVLLTLTHRLQIPADTSRCSATSIPVLIGQDVKLDFSVLTADQSMFDNSSSLLFQFSSTDVTKLSVDQREISGLVSSSSEVLSRIHRNTGPAVLTLSLHTYHPHYLAAAGLSGSTILEKRLQQSLRFRLVDTIHLTPGSITMFNYEDKARQMLVSGGSGVFSVGTEVQDIVQISSGSASPFSIRPVLQGMTTITVQDMCLSGQTAKSKVHVTGPAQVIINTISKVEINKSVMLTLVVVDSTKRKISSSVFPKLELASQITGDHIALSLSEDQGLCDEYCQVYKVDGMFLGTSRVKFTITQSRDLIHSNSQRITVFAPLRLSPSPVVLLEGAVFQLRYSGGPPHDSTLLFSSLNTTTAAVTQRALVLAGRVGRVEVVGQCVGIGPDSQEVYSQDTVAVIVLQLTGVEIRAPTTYILQGARIPLTVWGLDNTRPFTFASVSGISFTWSTSAPSLNLISLYDKSEYSVEDEKQFVISVLGVTEGVTMVTVVVSYTDSNGNVVTFSDSISIQVIKKAELLAPAHPDLLLSPGSVYAVRTNKDHTNTVHYRVLEGTDNLHIGSDGTVSAVRLGKTTLKIDMIEDRNINQTLLLHIEVKSPFAILVSEAAGGVPRSQSDYTYHTVPLGLSTSFMIETRDDIGRRFDSVGKTVYHYTLNRLDVVSVDNIKSNNSLSVTGKQVGEVVIQIESESGLEGWVYVRVSSPLEVPHYHILHKSTVCIPDLAHPGLEGVEWVSKDSGVAQLLDSGLVKAVGVGSTALTQQVTSTTQSIIKIDVLKIDSMSILASTETRVMSNIATPSTVTKLHYPVSITTDKPLTPLSANCQDKHAHSQLEFECVSSNPGVITAQAGYINNRPHCTASLQHNALVGGVLSPYITASVNNYIVSTSIKINFVPRFKFSIDHLVLSADTPSIDVTLSQGDISTIQEEDSNSYSSNLKVIKTSTHIHVSLLRYDVEHQHTITFVCPKTGQTEVISVNIVLATPPEALEPIKLELTELTKTILPTLVLGLLVLLIITGIVLLTTASYHRLTTKPTLYYEQMPGTPSPLKGTSPFRPPTISPCRLNTPLYTRPHGTPGTN